MASATPKFFDTQISAGDQIMDAFEAGCIATTFSAPVQWGKTGVMVYVSEQMVERGLIPSFSNAFIITGMADNEWKEQTQQRVPEPMKKNILHRCDLFKNSIRFNELRDAVIIVDECHFGGLREMTISTFFKTVGLCSVPTLQERNIRILQSSATPDSALLDACSWPEHLHRSIVADVPSSYVSFETLIDRNCVRPACTRENVGEITSTVFDAIEEFDSPKYHIVRLIGSTKAKLDPTFERACTRKNYTLMRHNSTISSKKRIQEDMFLTPPDKHTVILVKGLWRAAKTIPSGNIGVVYCGSSKHASIEAQGLAGRMCGHRKSTNIILFLNAESIYSYCALLSSKFDYSSLNRYTGNNITVRDYSLKKCKPSFMNPANFKGLDVPPPEVDPSRTRKTPFHRRFRAGEDYKLQRTVWTPNDGENDTDFFLRVKSQVSAKGARNPYKPTKLSADGRAMLRIKPSSPLTVFTLEEFIAFEEKTKERIVSLLSPKLSGHAEIDTHTNITRIFPVYDNEQPVLITYQLIPLKTLSLA